MTRNRWIFGAAFVTTVLLFLAPGWQSRAQVEESALGAPIRGLTGEQMASFEAGKEDFEEVHGLEQGLGPVFNGRSCSECHNQGATGGAGDQIVATSVTRFGKRTLGRFDPMETLGGSLIQRRSIREIDPSCPISGEVVPRQATIRTRRISTPLFGAGLIEAIPDSEILRRADPLDLNRDGISGRAHRVWNPESGRYEVGRFGWKAQRSTLHMFSGDAYLNEIGVTSPTFPYENLPQGRPIPAPWYTGPQLDDDGTDIDLVATYMQFLGPAERGHVTPEAKAGEQLFEAIGCASCHTPAMSTSSDYPVNALRGRRVHLYSDLLLHDMGAALEDGIVQGDAAGREFRTAPLWGVSHRRFLLHDGRATCFADAISCHGGEAVRSKAMFEALSKTGKAALEAFLRSL